MLEKKTIEVIVCDVCGVDICTAHIRRMKYLSRLGYQSSNDDPLAQVFKKLYIEKDICDRCQARMDHNFLGLSTEEKEQMVYLGLMEYDNRKDLREDPRVQKDEPTILDWSNLFDTMATMSAVQEEARENTLGIDWANIQLNG